jgi:hypothetical protein
LQLAEEIVAVIGPLLVTFVFSLLTQIYRQRSQIGLAETDPLRFALRKLGDSFAYQEESLYLMSLASKYVKALVKYLGLLMANGGEDIVANELIAMTSSLLIDIERVKAYSDGSLSPEERKILDEFTRIMGGKANER